MQVAVLNGTLSEAERAAYVRRVTAKYHGAAEPNLYIRIPHQPPRL